MHIFSTLVGGSHNAAAAVKRTRSTERRRRSQHEHLSRCSTKTAVTVTPERKGCCSSPIPINVAERERKSKDYHERLALPTGPPFLPAYKSIFTLSTAPLEPASVGSLSPVPYFTGYEYHIARLSDEYQDCDYHTPLQDSRAARTRLSGAYNGDAVSPLTLPRSCREDEMSTRGRGIRNGSEFDDCRQRPTPARSLSDSISMNEASFVSQATKKSRKCCFLPVEAISEPAHQDNAPRSNLYLALRQFEQDEPDWQVMSEKGLDYVL
jgi:hypothetical protein